MFSFYSSDTHYGHSNIIKYCGRPFTDVEEMTEVMIERHNAVVKDTDTYLHLGDFAFLKETKLEEVIFRLKGQKYLLRGNHDKKVTSKKFLEMGFLAVFPSYFFSYIGKHRVCFSHYPYKGYSDDKRYEDLRPPKDETIIVHGHTHEKEKLTKNKTIHVGVDAWEFRPASYEELKELLVQLDP